MSHGPSPTPTNTIERGYLLPSITNASISDKKKNLLIGIEVGGPHLHLAATIAPTVLCSCGLSLPGSVSTLLVTYSKNFQLQNENSAQVQQSPLFSELTPTDSPRRLS